MSILSVANVHFDTDGTNRIEYLAANGFLNLVTTGNIAISSRNFTLSNNAGLSGNVLTSNGISWVSQPPGISVVDEVNSLSTFYVTLSSVSSGTAATANISSTKLYYTPNTGTLSATTFNSLSDITLKDNIKNIENPLEKLEKMRGVTFTWKNNGLPSMGLIAQEVELGAPELVSEHEGIKNINYDGLTGLLVETIKELKARIEKLENNK